LKDEEEARIWMEHISSLFFLPPCFLPHSWKALANQKCRFRILCKLITRQKLSLVMPWIKSLSRQQKWSLVEDHMQQDRRPVSKIDLRARSICVCDFAYLVMRIWPHCNLLLMYQWWL
jgi:hypothetical protein